MRSGLQFRSTCATTSAVAGSISSVTRADEETQDDVFTGLRTGERHWADSGQGLGAAPAKQMRQVSHLMNHVFGAGKGIGYCAEPPRGLIVCHLRNLHSAYLPSANEMIREQTHA
jgi:hypothetical protein